MKTWNVLAADGYEGTNAGFTQAKMQPVAVLTAGFARPSIIGSGGRFRR